MIDNRTDHYPKRAETLQIITNHALAKIGSSGYVKELRKVDSKQQPILQIVDVLLGAITADTNQRLDRSYVLTPGKIEVIRRIAGLIGWDALSYDTYPNPAFNIWHFPIQFRGVFPSRHAHLNLQPV
ncbi:MAG TPA: hypothetical protein VNN10_12545 [Dehalococcoidia bacterium]|nr:hypothetical protein [Dehalococcoidia bacterium]